MKNNIKALLYMNNMTQLDLANKTGLSASTISRYITGDNLERKWLHMEIIADALNVDVSDLFTEDDHE
jgi:transcriptional regulator with XRE-family HTH domain